MCHLHNGLNKLWLGVGDNNFEIPCIKKALRCKALKALVPGVGLEPTRAAKPPGF